MAYFQGQLVTYSTGNSTSAALVIRNYDEEQRADLVVFPYPGEPDDRTGTGHPYWALMVPYAHIFPTDFDMIFNPEAGLPPPVL